MIPALRSALFALVFYPGTVIAVLSAFPLIPCGDRVLRRHGESIDAGAFAPVGQRGHVDLATRARVVRRRRVGNAARS